MPAFSVYSTLIPPLPPPPPPTTTAPLLFFKSINQTCVFNSKNFVSLRVKYKVPVTFVQGTRLAYTWCQSGATVTIRQEPLCASAYPHNLRRWIHENPRVGVYESCPMSMCTGWPRLARWSSASAIWCQQSIIIIIIIHKFSIALFPAERAQRACSHTCT